MKRALTLSIASISLAVAHASAAIPFVNISYNGDTIGAAPSTGPSADPLFTPTGIGGYTATAENVPPTSDNGSLVVGNIAGLSKAAVFTTNTANAELGALYHDIQVNHAEQHISMSFDLAVLAAPTTSSTQPKTLGGGTVGVNFGINTFPGAGGSQGVRFVSAATSATGGVFGIRTPDNSTIQPFFTYTEGTAYHVQIVSNYDTGIAETYVNGVSTGSLPFYTGAQPGFVTSEFFAFLNGDTGSANSVALDNFVAVPEPTTLAALAGASAFGLRRRRA